MGGAVACVESGWMQEQIARSSYEYQKAVEAGEQIVVGVNRFQNTQQEAPASFKIDDAIRLTQSQRLRELKSKRDSNGVQSALSNLAEAAKGTDNVMPHILSAVEQYATLGEISDCLRDVFGEYQG
jgi:methylmalonyl-CoA mutase N-terminal domain/subunit